MHAALFVVGRLEVDADAVREGDRVNVHAVVVPAGGDSAGRTEIGVIERREGALVLLAEVGGIGALLVGGEHLLLRQGRRVMANDRDAAVGAGPHRAQGGGALFGREIAHGRPGQLEVGAGRGANKIILEAGADDTGEKRRLAAGLGADVFLEGVLVGLDLELHLVGGEAVQQGAAQLLLGHPQAGPPEVGPDVDPHKGLPHAAELVGPVRLGVADVVRAVAGQLGEPGAEDAAAGVLGELLAAAGHGVGLEIAGGEGVKQDRAAAGRRGGEKPGLQVLPRGVQPEVGVGRLGRRRGLEGGELLADQFLQQVRLGVAHGDDGHARGPVPLPVELQQPFRRGRLHRLGRADGLAARDE